MVEVLEPTEWAERNFAQARLGDLRCTRRAVLYAAAAARSPAQSIPQQCGGQWKQIKGAYRLFDNTAVHLDNLQEPHRRLTLELAAERSVVLWLSDTTTVSFDHPETLGLGPTSVGGSGLLLHSTLGVDVSGGLEQSPFVLGLGHQQVWVRPPKDTNGEKSTKGKKVTKGKKGVSSKRPESFKWSTGIAAIGAAPPGVRWVHVGDSESDCWEAIESAKTSGGGFALRACQNRQVLAGHDCGTDARLLFELLQEQPMLGGKSLWVRGRKDQAARHAKLAVSAMALTLLGPKNWPDKPHRKGQPRPDPITCWAVRVWEIDVPAGQEPIEWVILSDEPVTDLQSALKVVFWYTCRWLIEEYHKCLKSGCRIESRQLEEGRRLQALLGILSVVAVRLLQLKHQAKVNPDAPAASVVPERYVKTLAAHLQQPMKTLTTRQFWLQTARLGGFLGRKGDGDPGWLTLWRGWEHLELLTAGFELAEKKRKRYG